MTIRLLIDNPAGAAPRHAVIDEFDSPNRWDEGLNGPDFLVSPGGEVFERLHFGAEGRVNKVRVIPIRWFYEDAVAVPGRGQTQK